MRVTVTGVVDLVYETDDKVEIVDYKIETTRRAEAEYRKQLKGHGEIL